ncbi:MAG: hypothetical protein PVH74_19755 [Desulfobacterales bacterium]
MLSAKLSAKSIGKMKDMGLLAALLAAMVALVGGAGCDSSSNNANAQSVVDLDDASIIVEVNATDGDAGFQIFLDGEGWEDVDVSDPSMNLIFESIASGGILEIGGGTELFLETEEPEFEEAGDLQDLLDLLPEGQYTFSGTTAEGDELTGTAELTHLLPCGPEVVSPAEAAILDTANPISISWESVEEEIDTETSTADDVVCVASAELVIENYQVIVEDEESGNVFDVVLSDEATSVTVPEEFFEEDTLYKFEILAIEESGNQTITESFFCTGPDGPGDAGEPCPEPE